MKTKRWNARYDEKWKISEVATSEEMIKKMKEDEILQKKIKYIFTTLLKC